LEAFRKLVGVPTGKYTTFTMLEKIVVSSSVKKINQKTPMIVSYELIREGRKIIAISFNIEGDFKQVSKEKVKTEISEKLAAFGFKENQINSFLKLHDEDYLLANIKIVQASIETGYKVRSARALLAHAFKMDYRPIETEHSKQQEQQEEIQAQHTQLQEEKLQGEKTVKAVYARERKEKVEALISELEKKKLEDLKKVFIDRIHKNNFFEKIYKSKGFDNAVIKAQRYNFLIEQKLPSQYHSLENFRTSKEEEGEISTP